jgi:hypothetical protein
MAGIISSLLPMMAGAALVPVYLIMVVLLLQRPDGLGVAAALVGGMTVVRLLQGVVFGFILVDVMSRIGGDEVAVIASAFLLALGVLLWASAVKQILNGEDSDAPPPKWLTVLDTVAPLTAFGIGAALVAIGAKQWVFTLGALGIIREADLNREQAVVAYLIFILGAEALMLLALLYSIVARDQSIAVLGRFGDWLERNNRSIVIVVSAVFGTFFLWKGLSGLIG